MIQVKLIRWRQSVHPFVTWVWKTRTKVTKQIIWIFAYLIPVSFLRRNPNANYNCDFELNLRFISIIEILLNKKPVLSPFCGEFYEFFTKGGKLCK